MTPARLVLILTTLSATLGAEAVACGNSVVMSTTGEDGRTIELVIDYAVAQKTPEWAPGRGDPPLSVARASEIAQEWAEQKYARFDGVEIREIMLSALGCTSSEDHWFYTFDFTPVMEGQRMYGIGNWAAVLMDGTVIGAEHSGPPDEPIDKD
jgi:hypothetical protein